jgi:nucleoid DNA-binding protein
METTRQVACDRLCDPRPRTGEQIQIAASQKVKFLPAKALKEVFNK